MSKSKMNSNPKSPKLDRYVDKMLEKVIEGKKVLNLRKNSTIFSQGAEANALYFIQSGRVKLTIAPVSGKEAVLLALLGPREFFGEGCLVGQSLRMSTAIATETSTLFEVQRRAMLDALGNEPALSEKFVASLLIRNIDMEQDIGNQLFNHSEKRLARVLLKLSRYGHHDFLPDAKLSQLSDDSLAQLAGTTPERVVHFLKKFTGLGLVYYRSSNIVVRAEMLADMVLHV
jgi:CRP/FNR family transcriptional regulator, cyclic AMP receptor protein